MEIFLIYASTSGNVEFTMEYIAKNLTYLGFSPKLVRSETASIEVILKNKRFIFGTSTWDHGKLNPFFENLALHMQKHNFEGKQAAFVGLGDRRYEPVLFARGIITIRDLWLEKGGEEISAILKIQGEPYAQLNSVIEPWVNTLAKTWIYQK